MRALAPTYHAWLRALSWFVPRAARGGWLAEWEAEAWHVQKTVMPPGRRHRDDAVWTFCRGALRDALLLRVDASGAVTRRGLAVGTPGRLLLLQTLLLLASLGLALAVPAARDAIFGTVPSWSDTEALVSAEGAFGLGEPTTSFKQYQEWKAGKQAAFRGLAFYRVSRAAATFDAEPPRELGVGFGSPAMLRLLMPGLSRAGVSPKPTANRPVAVLSRQIWRRQFHADLAIAGKTFLLGGRTIAVAGVVAEENWHVPGMMDVMVVEPDAALEAASPVASSSAMGYILAPALLSSLPAEPGTTPHILVGTPSGAMERFECLSLEQRTEHPLSTFLLAVLLACLALPATTPLPLGDYPERSGALTPALRVRRWFFLLNKLLFLLPPVFLVPLVLSLLIEPADSAAAAYVQGSLTFLSLLFALRWALQDQRRRCPTCLRALSSPALVGHASQSFLAWSGTEMLCESGHGFLYIPEHPTSWCSVQRWSASDGSWSDLFSPRDAGQAC